MGLSKRNRVRSSVAQRQDESNELILKYTRTIEPALYRAVRTRVWLEGMQKHLETTARALRDRPAAALAHFQKTLGRPSYFLTSTNSGNWVVLLGPRAEQEEGVRLGTQDSGLETLFRFFSGSLRTLHQWLMHPLVDTRPDSSPMASSTDSPYTLSVSGREPSEPA